MLERALLTTEVLDTDSDFPGDFVLVLAFAGPFFGAVIGILAFILWILLMLKAYQGELYKVPIAGDVADVLNAVVRSHGLASSPYGCWALP